LAARSYGTLHSDSVHDGVERFVVEGQRLRVGFS